MFRSNMMDFAAEEQVFYPDISFSIRANVRDTRIYDWAGIDYEGFWATEAEQLHWYRPWDKVLDWQPPFAQ